MQARKTYLTPLRVICVAILIVMVGIAVFAYWCYWMSIVSNNRLAEIKPGTPLHEVILKLGDPSHIKHMPQDDTQLLSWEHPLRSSHLTIQINGELQVDWAYMDW